MRRSIGRIQMTETIYIIEQTSDSSPLRRASFSLMSMGKNRHAMHDTLQSRTRICTSQHAPKRKASAFYRADLLELMVVATGFEPVTPAV